MVVAEPDIGEIIMRAFILRRVGLIQHAQGGVTVIGRKQDAVTLQIDRFLTRNGYPHRMLDIDTDEDSASAMEGFSINRNDLPVVILPDGKLVKSPSDKELADALGLTEELHPIISMTLLLLALVHPAWQQPYTEPPKGWRLS